VQALAALDPWLAAPVLPGRSTIAAELVYGVLAEGALTAEDLVERRTRLSLVDADRAVALAAAHRALDWAASTHGRLSAPRPLARP